MSRNNDKTLTFLYINDGFKFVVVHFVILAFHHLHNYNVFLRCQFFRFVQLEFLVIKLLIRISCLNFTLLHIVQFRWFIF
jgi:hypothetical protein